jgi:hypothetical protein
MGPKYLSRGRRPASGDVHLARAARKDRGNVRDQRVNTQQIAPDEFVDDIDSLDRHCKALSGADMAES